MIIKNCPICKKDFRARHSHNVFCSRVCGVIGRKGGKKKNQMKFICVQCGINYLMRASRLGKTKFCSKKCDSLAKMHRYSAEKNPNYKDGRALKRSGLVRHGGNRGYIKGRYYENKTRKILEAKGYFVVRSGGSRGIADLVALGVEDLIVIQVKAGQSAFGPADRELFRALKVPKNCRKELWVWLSKRQPRVDIF